MTLFNGSLRRPGALIAVAAAGVLGVGLSAGSASAHTPDWTVTCSSVSVNLTSYNGGHGGNGNTVQITVDGKDLLPVTKFGSSFKEDFKLPSHSKEEALHLSVKAFDGDQYSKELDAKSEVCPGDVTPPASPSQTPTVSPTESAPEAPSATPTETAPVAAPSSAPSSSAAVLPASQPSPAGDDLAETGSSSSTPIIAGGAAVVLVAGAGILWASRRRRAVQH